ncbi:hypothetical protein LEMLEM_LOCUS17242, partial [Lemmus lemmus]
GYRAARCGTSPERETLSEPSSWLSWPLGRSRKASQEEYEGDSRPCKDFSEALSHRQFQA